MFERVALRLRVIHLGPGGATFQFRVLDGDHPLATVANIRTLWTQAPSVKILAVDPDGFAGTYSEAIDARLEDSRSLSPTESRRDWSGRDEPDLPRSKSVSGSWLALAMSKPSNAHAIALGNAPRMVYKSNVRSIEHPFDIIPRSTPMTAMPATLDRPVRSVSQTAGGVGRTTAPAVRPGRRDGRGSGPQTRPSRPVQLPRSLSRSHGRSCLVAAPAPTRSAGWQLTDRGIAVILVVMLMIVVAALAVIGLTALRVTGDGYVAAGQFQSSTR